MRVFIAGATGVIGRATVPRLLAAGHTVHAVARSAGTAARLASTGATPVAVDLFDPQAVRRSILAADADAVVNLATSIPPLRKSTKRSAWTMNDRLRSEASANLVDGAIRAKSTVYLQESVAFLYADHGAEWITEDAPLVPSMFTPAVGAAEANAARFVSGNHGRGVVLRFGGFMSAESEFTRTLIEHARRGTLYDPGPRHGYFPWVVVDDAAAAVVRALEIPSGTYNVVDDAQMTRDEKAEVLARAVGRDRPLRRLPTIVTRLAGDAGASARRSMRVSNTRLRDLGWTPVQRQPVDFWSSLANATSVAVAA